jgi:hypothetical protein
MRKEILGELNFLLAIKNLLSPPTFNVLALEFQLVMKHQKEEEKSDVHAIVTLVATNTLLIKETTTYNFSQPQPKLKNITRNFQAIGFFWGCKVLLAHP